MSHKLVRAEPKLNQTHDRQLENEPWTWNLEPSANLLAEVKAYIESSAQSLQHKNYQLIPLICWLKFLPEYREKSQKGNRNNFFKNAIRQAKPAAKFLLKVDM